MKIRSWRWVVLVVVMMSMAGAAAALAQKAPRRRADAPSRRDGAGTGHTARGRNLRREGRARGRHRRPGPPGLRTQPDQHHGLDLEVERVLVLDPSRGGRVVEELSGDEIASRIVVFGNTPGATDKRFGPGVVGLLFMDVTYPAARGCRSSSSTASTSRPARPQGWPRASGPGLRAWPRKSPPGSARRSQGKGG